MTHRFIKDRSGATAVEFAIVFWPLMLLLLGTVEVGRVLWTQTALDKTAMTVARCIGIRADGCATSGVYKPDLAVAFAKSEAGSWGISLTNQMISLSDDVACDELPGFSRVTLQTKILSPLPFISTLLGSEQMSAEACFPRQADPA
ncbi:TadE-like protein [Rhizobium sp. PP-F2F-G20b]|nr:TadE-like protein [Rhizobium sp. PP-F2F-G20b]